MGIKEVTKFGWGIDIWNGSVLNCYVFAICLRKGGKSYGVEKEITSSAKNVELNELTATKNN